MAERHHDAVEATGSSPVTRTMKFDEPVHFEVHLSTPVEGKAWHQNYTLDVITFTASQAIQLALKRYSQGTVHVVQRRGSANLIFDPDVVELIANRYYDLRGDTYT